MWLIDQWAERHIASAQDKGLFDDLPGAGKPLLLDDYSHVPAELRAGYRLLKNAGYLPPEIAVRNEAVELCDLLKTIREDDPRISDLQKQMTLLELKLRHAGQNTDFLHGDYGDRVIKHINGK